MQPFHLFHCIIIGAGASGLFAGCLLGKKGIKVALIDHAAKTGKKLALAGGGMGNMTNMLMSTQGFVGEDTDFCKEALKKFRPKDVITILQECGIPWEEREDGQIFGKKPARDFADNLTEQFKHFGGKLFLEENVKPIKTEAGFRVALKNGMQLEAPCLVIATGSPAWPQCGASNQGAEWAKVWGHEIKQFEPVLAPLLFSPANRNLGELSGISHMVGVAVNHEKQKRSLLFSHMGFSGPAALIASCFWKKDAAVAFDFLPEKSLKDMLHAPENGKLLIKNLLARHMPERLALALCPEDLGRRKAAEVGKKDRERLEAAIHRFSFIPAGTAGLKKAEAAKGGVLVKNVNPRTMESTLVPGLYFLGEVLDITGILGGYNLHWAFASANLLAEAFPKAGFQELP